jgi:hypothetical protein
LKRRNKHVNILAYYGQKTYNRGIGESMNEEAVNSPSHYNQTELECIDAIRYALGEEGFIAYCKGNALKYTWRSGHKIDSSEDLKKAAWYCRMASGDDPRKDPGYHREAPIKDLRLPTSQEARQARVDLLREETREESQAVLCTTGNLTPRERQAETDRKERGRRDG